MNIPAKAVSTSSMRSHTPVRLNTVTVHDFFRQQQVDPAHRVQIGSFGQRATTSQPATGCSILGGRQGPFQNLPRGGSWRSKALTVETGSDEFGDAGGSASAGCSAFDAWRSRFRSPTESANTHTKPQSGSLSAARWAA